MGLRKTVAGGVAALASGALPFAAHVLPAAADDYFFVSQSFDHTFTDVDGQQMICTVDGESSLMRRTGESTFSAFAATGTFRTGCSGYATLDISYRDAQGIARHIFSTGFDSVTVTIDGVHDSWVARHHITFDHCAENCIVEFTTTPK